MINYKIFDYLKQNISNKTIAIIVISSGTGLIIQSVCQEYLKKHPQLSSEPRKDIRYRIRRFRPFNKSKSMWVKKPVYKIVIPKLIILGLLLISGGTIIYFIGNKNKLIFTKAVTKYFGRVISKTPDPLTIIINGQKIHLSQCDLSVQKLFTILNDETVSYMEKKQAVKFMFQNSLDFQTPKGRIQFVLCLVSLIFIFSNLNTSSYVALLENLITAIKDGRISKATARMIIRRLLRLNVILDPELVDLVNS